MKSGAAKLIKSADGGETEAVLATLAKGDRLGEIGLIDGRLRSANVTAMQTT